MHILWAAVLAPLVVYGVISLPQFWARKIIFWANWFLWRKCKIIFAFRISFWMCADLLFCTCNVSLACSPDARTQCSLNTDGSRAQHNPALQYAMIPANQRQGWKSLIGCLDNQSQHSLHYRQQLKRKYTLDCIMFCNIWTDQRLTWGSCL